MGLDKIISYNKILNCIESCTTQEQTQSIRNMLGTYLDRFQDYSSVENLWIQYNLKFFEIKNGKI